MKDKDLSPKPRRSDAEWLKHSAKCIDKMLADVVSRCGQMFEAGQNLPPGVLRDVCGVAGPEGLRQAIDEIIAAHRFGEKPRNLEADVTAALDKHGTANPWRRQYIEKSDRDVMQATFATRGNSSRRNYQRTN